MVTSKPHGNHKKIYNTYIHRKRKKESKHKTKDSHQITRELRGKEEKRPTKQIQGLPWWRSA